MTKKLASLQYLRYASGRTRDIRLKDVHVNTIALVQPYRSGKVKSVFLIQH